MPLEMLIVVVQNIKELNKFKEYCIKIVIIM